MTNLADLLNSAIAESLNNPSDPAWKSGEFAQIRSLEIDRRGEVGEIFFAAALQELGYTTYVDRSAKPDQKQWDILVKDEIKLEIKTATASRAKFQHEHIIRNRDFNALVLVDISPSKIFLTCAAKNTLPWDAPSDKWTVKPKKMVLRPEGVYKWDLTFADVKDREITTLEQIRIAYETMLNDLSA